MTKPKKATKRRSGQSASKAMLERDAARYRFLRDRTKAGACIGIWKETEDGAVIEGGWVCGREADSFVDLAMRSNAALTGAATNDCKNSGA
jgi:hypothetical protein